MCVRREFVFSMSQRKTTELLPGPRGPGLAGCLGGRRGKHLSLVWQERCLLCLLVGWFGVNEGLSHLSC